MVFSKNGQVIDGSGQSIVILDTGIDLDHPFFGPDQNNDGISDRIAAQSDFASKPYNGNPENNDDDDASDTNGHGSHVASIAASSDPNYPGIAPGADIIVLKIFDSNNSGNFLDIEQALQWVLANYQEYNIASVNMSLSTGGNHVNPTNFGIIGDELQQLAAANVIPVSAAGNTGKFGVSYPAANPYSLAVSSIDDYTNRKISSFSQHHPDLTDVFADGQGIRAANQNGGTTVKSGTSMAAPVVSGAIAVAQQLAEQELGRRLTFDEIKTLLAQGDDLLAPTKYEDDYQGKVLNIDNLGNAILAMAPSKPPQPPFSGVIAQVGRISDLNHNNQTILLDHTFTDPVIFAHTLSFNNGDPSIPRITDIQGGEFSLKLQEPENLDGTHINESLSFLALEKGIWELSDGTIIEVGTTTTDATTKSGWESITFNHDFANTPIVLTQVQTYNDPSFVRTRQNNISKNGFEVALEEQELNLNNTRGSETIAWMAISSGTGEWDGNAFMAGNTGDQVTDNWHTIDFGNTFNNLPQLFGNIASYDGPDSAGLRYQNLSNDTVEIKIEEDTSLDDETVHTTENIGFLAIEGTGTLTGETYISENHPNDQMIAQVGRISDLNHNNQTIVLDHTFTDPVIFAHTLSFNNGDPSIPRITDIQGGEFSLKLQEPENLDGTHINESLSFLALEKGIWELSDGTIIEVGTTTTDATTKSGWESITFNHDFANAPIVLTQVQTYNDPSFVRTRQNNISKNGFEVALEGQELNLNNARGSETIAWMAISSGTGEWDGNAFMAGNTGDQVTDNWHTIDFGNTFNNLPQLFGNIASYDGPDSAGLRYQNLSDDTVEIKIEEDTSLDDETVHTTENIGFLAIEGTGTLTGASFSPLTALIDNNIGTGDAEAFTLGDKSEAFYDNYGQQDYAEIFDFDTAQDVIQLHGIASDYSLRASPFSGNAQGIFLRVPGMEDELIGIVHNTSTLDLNSNNFVFV